MKKLIEAAVILAVLAYDWLYHTSLVRRLRAAFSCPRTGKENHMLDRKFFLRSKTVWGAIFAFLPSVLQAFGVMPDAALLEDAQSWGEQLLAVIDQGNELLGAALIIWGRVKASAALTLKPSTAEGAFLRMPALAVLLALFLPLGGCAEFAAIAINDARALHDSASGYVRDVHDTRREVRDLCWEMLKKEVDALEAAGDYEAARSLLKANYPDLVSAGLIKKALEDAGKIAAEPFGCEGSGSGSTVESAAPS